MTASWVVLPPKEAHGRRGDCLRVIATSDFVRPEPRPAPILVERWLTLMSTRPNPQLAQAFNDVLAKMMQADVKAGCLPHSPPRGTSAEVRSQIHMADLEDPPSRNHRTVYTTKQELEKTLTERLDRLRDEIHEVRTRSVTLQETALTKWSEMMADLDVRQKAAREMLGKITTSTGAAWEHLRDGASVAWDELERAVRKARAEF